MQFVSALTLLGFDRPGEPTPAHPTFAGEWATRFDDVGGVYSAFTRTPGAVLRLPLLEGPAHLVVMCTGWSGMIEIRAGNSRAVVDCYAPVHTLREISIPGEGVRNVELELLGDRHVGAIDSQLWLHRLVVERHQPWLDRVTRPTRSIDVTNARFGTFATIRGDVGISHAIRTYGAWGPEQVALFERVVQTGSTVIDIGANIGHHTVVLSRLVGAHGRVLAFEPQQFVCRVLQTNLALNGCANTEAHQCALGASDGEATMSPSDYETGAWNVGGLGLDLVTGYRGATANRAQVVKVRRLDDVARDFNVDFIKCDAQGFDFEVLKGAADIIARCRPALLFEVAPLSMPGGAQRYLEMYAMLEAAGYCLLDPESPDPSRAPRHWSGVPEEWDVLALQEHQLARIR